MSHQKVWESRHVAFDLFLGVWRMVLAERDLVVALSTAPAWFLVEVGL